MKIHASVRQRSPEWHALRRGIPTASNFDKIILPSGKRSGQARRYMHQLAWETLTGRVWEGRDLSAIPAVQNGIAKEDAAVHEFERRTTLKCETIGFITDDRRTMGCSPDRIIANTNWGLEIKVPTGPVHVGYLIEGIEDAYKAQLQGQILIGQFELVHFFAYSEELPCVHEVVTPDRVFLARLSEYLEEFRIELADGIAHVRRLGHWPRNAASAFPEDEGDGTA